MFRAEPSPTAPEQKGVMAGANFSVVSPGKRTKALLASGTPVKLVLGQSQDCRLFPQQNRRESRLPRCR